MSLEALKFAIQEETSPQTKIRVLGVGGGGSNAVARMLDQGLSGVDFCVLNTDTQALGASPVPQKLPIGSKLTSGLGAGSDPSVGHQAALEDTDRIIDLLEGSDMVFVTAGLGGGTGTGAAPVVASLAKELGALTVAVVTMPFGFEGAKRRKQAERGLTELANMVDTIITIPNDRLLSEVPKGTSIFDAFRVADDVLHQAVQGISDIITTPGLVNRDFSDVRAIMHGMGHAMMGTAIASGENAAVEAARRAIASPLLDEGGIRGAKGVLINITGSHDLDFHQVNDACLLIAEACENEDVQLNWGVVQNESMGDQVKITVIATGFARQIPAGKASKKSAAVAAPVEPLFEEPVESAMQEAAEEAIPDLPVYDIPAMEPPPLAMAASATASAAPASAALPGSPVTNGVHQMDIDEFDIPPILKKKSRLIH